MTGMVDAPASGFPLWQLSLALAALLAVTGVLLAAWSTLHHRRRLLLAWAVAAGLYGLGWGAFVAHILMEVS